MKVKMDIDNKEVRNELMEQIASALEDKPPHITGRVVEKCESLGKHLLIWFSGDLILRTHMRMSGSWMRSTICRSTSAASGPSCRRKRPNSDDGGR